MFGFVSEGNVEQGYRLSPPQKRLCTLQQEDGDRRYGARCAVLIEGPLDAGLLDRALQSVVERHDSLRTTFVRPPGLKLPVQVVAESAGPARAQLDLRHLDARRQEEELEQLFRDEELREFDPGRGSLLRATLLSLADDRHALLLSLPALCADSRTLSNIVTQLAHAYGACAAGAEPPEPALQYVQFSQWQNEIMSDEEASEGEAFWRERAAAAPPLPFVARSAAASPAHEVFNSFVAPETAAHVRRAAQRYETTIEVYLLACWQTLLWRLTGQPEIAVGVMCNGRKFEELNDSLGLFARWLPLAVTFRRELPFSAVLRRVAEHKSEAEEWQEYFIWHERREEGGPSRPYPEIGFEYAPDSARHTAAGVKFSTLRQYACTDRADLKLHVADAGERLAAELHYDVSLFEAADIERLAAQFSTLLASAAADPEAPVSRLEILDDGQRRQVLCEFNRTAADYPLDKCLHELVEAQVARTPDAVALIFEGECVTYDNLNTRANQLAHRLSRLGAGAETLIGICLERSSEMVVGALGVLKAGAAYVPLDPEYPAERLRYMLEDARVSVLLTSARLAKKLPEHSAHTILLDTDRDSLACEDRHNPRTRVRPDNLAYVIYTSGSTGQPKGTMNTHRGVCNRQFWMQEVYPLTASDRVLQLSSFSFDFSVWEFWGTLSAGAALVLPRPGGHKESAYLRRLVDEQGITAAHFVPSMLQVFLEEVGPGDCRSLRRVFVGGEALSRELQERFFSRLGASLHNQYGPTETSIDVTYWDCRRDDEPGAVPIGRPNANNALYILDPEGRPVPVAASGELYIGGVAVGRGYFNRLELTAERFIPDPFSEVAGARMYRTGDLARHRGDGCIDYLGRIDEQVKVRGFRIELGEVEAALESHPLVREAVVVPQQGPSGDKRLVGFVVCTRPQAVSAAELRAYAAGKLPEFMLPALVVELERMPLTGSGKADRLALAQTEVAAEARAGEETAPRTLVEELVCGIWAEVLGVEGVGVSDNFFDLGGHSLLATRVVSRVREAFGVELELRELFDGPTVEELGRGIEGRLSAGAGQGGPPLRREEREGTLPLSFAQQRLWFIEQMRSGGAAYNLPAAFRLKGKLNAAALEQTLSEIARRHETLRTVFETEQGRPHQVVRTDGGIGFITADLRQLEPRARDEQVRRLAAEEAGRSFDLSQGPLVRARLLAVADDEHVLLLTMHHIVSDGWSMGLFIRETAGLYAAYRAGLPSPLAELPVQYADFARWQREWLSGAALDRQLEYWCGQLRGVGALELPTDYPRPAVQTHRGAREAIEIDAELSEKLRQLSRREGVTLFMTLLAAFEVLLHRYSGQQEIIVGTPIAGRNHKEIEGLIGFFVNTLVLRGEVRGGDSYRELLKTTREVMLGAYAHQDVPFEKLVEELQPQRDLSRSPLFQVMFSFQPPAGDAIELPGLTVEAEPVGNATAKFDLTVDLKDGGQGLYGELEYNTDLFAPETTRRMVRHFRKLLESIAEEPEQKISEVALLTEGERAEILGAWNRTAAEYPPSECVHELIAAQARSAPDQVAVASGTESVTYRQLEKRADKLADYLAAHGVGPEVRVGICVERGVEMLVALLGILKAGGAYVPLDPGYPKERLAYMVEDSQLALLLTEESLRERLPDCAGEVVCLDARRDEIARASERPSGARVGGDNLAYVIYTSGSTGRPKGVMISHRALVNLLCSMREQPGLSEEDVLLAVTSISFDIAALELYLPLLVGARVRIADRRTAADGEALRRELIDAGATVMQATPTTWRVLLESGWRNETRIKAISGGEPLPEGLSRTLSELTPSLWNVYGPTETTIWSTALRVEGPGAVTIGRPVANTQIYILGEGWQPTPVGVAGHLLIGGDGLARGYHLRPELTAEQFVPDPFSGRAGERLYQTGDLARYRPDGQIEFLGRNDQQVKIRGYRIETGEVEAALNRHPGVRVSVVAPYAGEGDLRLAAYLLSDDPQGLDPVELRRFLKEKLPEYMIPTAFVRLEDFPRTPNGKIDRKALPAPAQAQAPGGRASLAARTPIEEELVRIWAELLGAEPASVHDNFFELGGYSLLAMQMNHRLRETFRLDIPLVALFESPTIAELAAEVARRRAEQGDSHPPAAAAPIITPDPANRYEPFPLNDVQQAYWIGRESSFELGGVASHSYTEIDFLVLDVERLNDALRRVIERHDMLRAIVLPDGKQRVLREVPPYRIAVHDLSARRDAEVEAHLRTMRERMSHQVLPTDRWPLFDVQVTRMPGGKVRLHFSLDYLIVDAWSLGLVFGEIFEFYEQPALELPVPELSFRDFVLAELAEQETEVYKEAERYWLGRLPTLPPAPELPLAVSPETLHRPRFIRRAATLSRDRWQRIKAHGLRHGLTPTAVLLGAFSEILAAWSKSPRFTVNLTIFNRPPVHPEILDIVGDFTSLTLLEVDGARAGSFGLRARAIQEQLWNDLERRAVSGIRVQRELARKQSKQATSIMPVVFTSTLGQRDQAIDPTAGGQARPDLNEKVYTITQTPQVWLDHQVGEVGGELLFNWDAVEDLFFPGVLDDMWQAYNRLLDSLCEEVAWQQTARGWLPEAQEAQRRLVNATDAPLPQGLLHTGFIEQARKRRDEPAVIGVDRTLTYGELDEWSTELARHLQHLGLRPNQLVAVVMEKGWEQVVAVLSILKAGAAYLPID
ncbi:MAG: amino acid adenylation domain-containing protein, partial [Pyrinomonadaceae bacterium]